MDQILEKVAEHSRKPKVADIRVGETVRVHYKIREANKERLQVFEGLVIAVKKSATIQGSFTVRKVITGVGVERTFPLHSPHLAKVERVKSGKVRQAKLNFVRRYALSRRFKLKDKGLEGTIWEEIAKDKEAVEEESARQQEGLEEIETKLAVAPEAETTDNGANEDSAQNVEKASEDAGSETPPDKETPNSEA